MPEDVMDVEANDIENETASGLELNELNEWNNGEGMPEESEEPEPVEGEESEEEQAPEEETEKEEEKPAPTQDGRNMPDAAKKGLAALKTSNPEAAKYFRSLHFQNADYRAAFATPADAIALKNQFEEIGGAEGLAAIEAERQEWAQVESSLGEGKAADLLAGDPDLLAKNAVGVINKWSEVAPQQFGYFQDKVTFNKMGGESTLRNLNAVYQSLEGNPQAQGAIADLHNSLLDMQSKAAEFEQKRVDPREEQLKQRETEFETKRRADFEGQVAAEAESYRDKAIERAIEGLLNGRKADPDQMKHYVKLVREEVGERLGKIPGFDRQIEAQYRTGDRAASVSWINRQFDRIINQGKAADVIAPLLRNVNPPRTAPAKTNGARPASKGADTPGMVNLSEMPNWDQVDWTRTDTAQYASGKAVLTNGKQARW